MGEQEGEGRLIGLQGELREALEAGEREQEMCQYLNTKLAEISQVEVGVVKEAKVVWEQKLEKSLTAIQGFLTENSKLWEQVVRRRRRSWDCRWSSCRSK